MKVVFCTPTVQRPFGPYLDAMEASYPLFEQAGIDANIVLEVGSPYISHARSVMLRKALTAKADVIVFIDHDLSWEPADLFRLVHTEGDVVAGTYRFKQDEESYMGKIFTDDDGRPSIIRSDGCIRASCIPAGFLKITPSTVERFMIAYPNLIYGKGEDTHVDLFNHGAFGGLWFGEDYAFSRNWNDLDGEIWLRPDLDIAHHTTEKAYPGNFHEYLMRLPGGAKCEAA